MGIVFNAHYFLYFDIGVTELWRAAGLSYAEMAAAGVDTAVVEATAKFRAPARFDDLVDIEAAVDRLGRTSAVIAFRIWRDEELLCEGHNVYVFVDRDTHEKIDIPQDVRAALAGQDPAPAAAAKTEA